MIVSIYISNDKLELFEDENISVTSSVLDIQDITKNTTDYSNAFTVPASDVNNKIFKHYYNADIDNTFDARVSVDGRIEIGGMPFRTGKILLQKVNVKSGIPSNYTINFFGNLVSLKDIVGDDKLSDVNLSVFNHVYNSTFVLALLQNAPPALIGYCYNLLVKKQYYYSSDPTDLTMTDQLANIAYKSAGSPNGVKWDDLRPSIRILSLISAIEDHYSIEFSRDFFNRPEFSELFMWFSNSESEKVGGRTEKARWTAGDTTFINLGTDIGTFPTVGIKGASGSEWFNLIFDISPAAGFESVKYTVNFYSEAGVRNGSWTGTGTCYMNTILQATLEDSYSKTYLSYWDIVPTEAFDYSCNVTQEHYKASSLFASVLTTGDDSISSLFEASKHAPDIKVIDLLKGLFEAFKLVILPLEDGTFYVNSVSDYYSEGQLIDVTNYIDVESVDVSRGDILNTINYKFQEPQTILNSQFKDNNNQIAYGDAEIVITDDSGNILDGGKLESTLPFEQVVYEKLIDTYTGDETGILYGSIIDKNLNAVNIKAHIFYNNYLNVTEPFAFIKDTGISTPITGNINTATHIVDQVNPTNGFVFDEEFNEWNNSIITNTLYSNYHQTYVENLFNIKRRNFTYKTKTLPVPILLDLTLNDILKIGYNYFRIDKFTTNLVTGETEFNLVNAFDFDLTAFTSKDTYIIISSDAQTYSAYVTNLTTYTAAKVDLGSGTTWITVGDSGSFITFTATANVSTYRDMQVNITDDVSGTIISFYIGQREYNHQAKLDFSNVRNAVYNTILLTTKT